MQEYFDHGILENQAKQLQVEVKYNGQQCIMYPLYKIFENDQGSYSNAFLINGQRVQLQQTKYEEVHNNNFLTIHKKVEEHANKI